MRQNIDPKVSRALRLADEWRQKNSASGPFRKATWGKSQQKYSIALLNAAAALFEIWLRKLPESLAENVRTQSAAIDQSLASFFAWLVQYSFKLANEPDEETERALVGWYVLLFLEGAGYSPDSVDLYYKLDAEEKPPYSFEGVDEADRWTVENFPFLRTVVATIAAICSLRLTVDEEIVMQGGLLPTLNSVVLSFAHELGITTKPLVG